MRKRKSYILKLSVLTVMLCLCFLKQDAYADTGTGNGTDSSIDGKVDPNAEASGISKYRSGYLLYLVNKDSGAVTSPVILVPYISRPADGVKTVLLRTRLGDVGYSDYYRGGGIAEATNHAWTQPPFTVDGGTFGSGMKAALLKLNSKGDAYLYNFIINVLGKGYADQFKQNDERLCIEAVAWTGFTSGGSLFAYTAKTGAQVALENNYI